jgi:hypothetical protein
MSDFDPDAWEAAHSTPTATARARTDKDTTLATSPQEAVKERKASEMGSLRAELGGGAAAAAGYGLARGASLGLVDRLAGAGTAIGEQLGATPQTPADPNAYAQGRGEYLAGEKQARAAHPVAGAAGEIAGGMVPAIATSGMSRFAQAGALGGVAGAGNTASDNPLDVAKSAAFGVGGGLATEGTLGTGLRALLRRAPKRKEDAFISDVAESDAGRAIPTVTKRLVKDLDDVRSVAANDPEVAAAAKLPADEGRPVIQQRMKVAREGQPERYEVADRALAKDPITVTQLLSKLVEAEKGLPGSDLVMGKKALLAMRDDLRNDFAPRWSGGASWNGEHQPITIEQLREWVSAAQATGERAMGGINGTNAHIIPHRMQNIANSILEERLDKAAGAGAKQAVDGIRESDRVFSALKRIDETMESRGVKEQAQAAGLGTKMEKESRKQRLAAAAALASTGHPGAAAAVVGSGPLMQAASSGARAINDSVLAPLQKAAEAGVPWAQLSRMAIEQGIPLSTTRMVLDRVTNKPYQPTPTLAPKVGIAPSVDLTGRSTSLSTGLRTP